ncbi:MAG: PD-(D/E)XK nuclease family protein [Vicinamibacterales bacterium]
MHKDVFVQQLSDLCRQEPARAKWVFVPTHPVGNTVGDRLAREGCDWANLRFVTPRDVAIRMAAPFFVERGIAPSEEQLGPALILRLMLDLSTATGGYFRPMAEHYSMAEALWRTVRELRYAGIRAGDLAKEQFTPNDAKRSEIVALFAAYGEYLETNHLADDPLVFEEAARQPAFCPIRDGDFVTELPGVVWSPVVRTFIDSLPGRRIRARAPALPGTTIPARWLKLGPSVEWVDAASATTASRLRFLKAPEAAGPPTGDATLDIFHAGGRDAEVDEVFRRILDEGWPLDQVEIACASAPYQLLVYEKAARLGWKVTLSGGVPAAATRPGRLLLRLCDWISGNFAAADLRKLLQSGDCRPPFSRTPGRVRPANRPESPPAEDRDSKDHGFDAGSHGNTMSAGQAARLLLKAHSAAGRGNYRYALTRLAEKYAAAAADDEATEDDRSANASMAERARLLLAWIQDSLDSIPAPEANAGNTVALASLADAAAAFTQANSEVANQIDAVARASLVRALGDLRALGDYRCSVGAGLGFLRGRVNAVTVARERPRPGHLHISTLAEAGYDGRSRVFVVGLEEGGVFPAVSEDPVLLDAERASFRAPLRSSMDGQNEAVAAALSRLAAVGMSAARVSLSFSCYDTRDFRQTFPSWIVLQAFRIQKGNARLTYGDLAEALGEPASAVPNDSTMAPTETGWWLARATAAPAARSAVLAAFPSLVLGAKAEEQRSSAAFTGFDGHVPAARLVLDPTVTGRPVSVTMLESLAACPLRYFMEQGLGIRPIEEGAVEEDVWLDPLTRGSELHELFARLVRTLRDEKREPDLRKDRARLAALGRKRLDELREEMPPPSEECFRRESRDFLDDLDVFIEAECEGRHGTEPVGIEVSFGLPLGDAGAEALSSGDPIPIDLGRGRQLLLRGRIDRINRLADGQYEVLDYKTGSYRPDEWRGAFAGGTRLQHALYGVAAEELLRRRCPRARVVLARYVFPAVKGHRRQKIIASPSRAKLSAVLDDVLDVVREGAFLPADAEEACKWCAFARACHSEDVSRAIAKRDNPENAMLEPLRRLRRDHE